MGSIIIRFGFDWDWIGMGLDGAAWDLMEMGWGGMGWAEGLGEVR